jgi:DNA-binding ferritin-like protein
MSMTENAKDAWGEVGERFASWGRRVSDRYKETGSVKDPTDAPTGELQRTAKELVDELSRGFSALNTTIRDDAANKELSDALDALGDAIKATVTEAGQSLRSGGSGSKGNSTDA